MSFANLQYHIAFSTKERRPFLQAERLSRTCEYIGGIIREQGGQRLAANGTADHVHIATMSPPTVAVSDLLRTIKTNSSAWIHQTFPDMVDFHWQDGYAVFSVSASVMPRVLSYIRRQAEHHKKMSLMEELVSLLDKHGIEYDRRYVFS